MKVGFIGLGNMGLPMAINLVEAGVDVTGYDVVEEQRESLEQEGGNAAENIESTVSGASIVISMVRTPDQVKSITDEAFDVIEEDTLYIDMSTIGPKACKDVFSKAQEKGIEMIDAPVSGGVPGSESGTLTIMAGGPSEAFSRAHDVFEIIGRDIYHVGSVGAGQTAKMSLQTLVGAEIASICEAFRLAEEADVDLEILYDILTDSIGTSGILEVKGERILEGNYDPTGDINLQHKDMELVLDTAEDLTIPMYITAAVTQEFVHARKEGLGEKDQFALFELYHESD